MVTHKHHIIENRDGKRFKTDTTITLSVEEHSKIHKQYWEDWGFYEDYVASITLAGQIGKEELLIEKSRIGGLNNKGKKKTPQHAKKISQANKGQVSHWTQGDIDSKRSNLSKSMQGNTNFDINKPGVRKTHSDAMKEYHRKRKLKADRTSPPIQS